MPPAGQRAGDIILVDSTNFTTLFGGTESLKNFWHNLATMKSGGLQMNWKKGMKMPGLAAIVLGSAPVFGGALLAAAGGQFFGRDFRTGIKEDMELLERLPEDEESRRAALRRSIADRIDDLVAANEKRRQLRAAAIVYQGNW
jgi:hypothetical protein